MRLVPSPLRPNLMDLAVARKCLREYVRDWLAPLMDPKRQPWARNMDTDLCSATSQMTAKAIAPWTLRTHRCTMLPNPFGEWQDGEAQRVSDRRRSGRVRRREQRHPAALGPGWQADSSSPSSDRLPAVPAGGACYLAQATEGRNATETEMNGD